MADDRVHRVIDFDALRGIEPDPIVVRFKSHDIELPGRLPVIVEVDLIRMHQRLGDDGLLSEADLTTLGADLFGSEAAWRDVMRSQRLSADDCEMLLKAILHEYGTN